VNRRKMLSAAPVIMLLAGTATAGAAQAATPKAEPSFYSTLDPEQQAAFDKLHAIVKAQADGTWVEPPDPDAELHARCAEFHRQHAEGRDVANPEWEKADAAAWDAFKQLDDTVALTHRGCRAKAEVAVTMLVMFHEGTHGGDPEAVFALNMLRNWLELPA